MRAIGRCNGIPGDVLAGAIEEDNMDEPTPIGRRVATDLTLPCGTCAHSDVCRIKPTLSDLLRLAVALPVLDPAIGVDLSASVSCSHYSKGRKTGTDEARPKRSMSPEGRARIKEGIRAARERAATA
jgi:hypothetical protein